jgi:hypothetical protein
VDDTTAQLYRQIAELRAERDRAPGRDQGPIGKALAEAQDAAAAAQEGR